VTTAVQIALICNYRFDIWQATVYNATADRPR